MFGGQAAVGMRASTTASVTGDEPFYLVTTQSLLSDGNLDLRDEYADRSEMDRFWDGTIPLWKQMEPTASGRLLSPHDPGLAVLIAPAYAALGLRGAQRFLVVVWAAAMAFGAVLARRAGAPAQLSVVAAVALGVGAPGIVYASQIYPEGPAALCISIGLLLATARVPAAGPPADRRPAGGDLVRSVAGSTGMVVVLAVLLWLGVKYLPYALLIGGAWAWRQRLDLRPVGMALVLAVPLGAHYVWWHLETFGALVPYASNVVWAGEGTSSILEDHLGPSARGYRLYGLFLDARFGLFRWSPMSLVAVWGITRRTALHVAVVAVAVLLGTFLSITIMGWWFPGRMLVAAFPALVVLVAKGAAGLPRRLAWLLGAWSLAIGGALAWSARTGAVRLAVDPWTLGVPLPPAWLFPDFRSFSVRQVGLSAAWALVLLAGWLVMHRRAGLHRSLEAGSEPPVVHPA